MCTVVPVKQVNCAVNPDATALPRYVELLNGSEEHCLTKTLTKTCLTKTLTKASLKPDATALPSFCHSVLLIQCSSYSAVTLPSYSHSVLLIQCSSLPHHAVLLTASFTAPHSLILIHCRDAAEL